MRRLPGNAGLGLDLFEIGATFLFWVGAWAYDRWLGERRAKARGARLFRAQRAQPAGAWAVAGWNLAAGSNGRAWAAQLRRRHKQRMAEERARRSPDWNGARGSVRRSGGLRR
jgi:hypothetical protein